MSGSTARLHLAIFGVVAAALVACVVAFRIDLSAGRYFRNDTVVRDAWPEREIPRSPYFDPAPWAIWIPSDLFVRESILAGHLPLWDRLQGGGYSPVLTVQNGVFHPLRWMLALVPADDAASVLVVIVAAAGFAGMWLYLRSGREASVAAAWIGATLYAFSSALLSFLHFSGASFPLAHLPWVALALQHAIRRRSVIAAIPLVVAIALLAISGHPLLVAAVAVVVVGIACIESWEGESFRPLRILTVAAVAAALLAAFALLPPLAAREELWSYKTGSRYGSVYAPFAPYGEWFRAVATVVVDSRRPTIDDSRFALTIGAAAALLTLVGAFTGLPRRRGAGWFLLAIATAALAIPGPFMLEASYLPPLTYMNRWYFTGALAFVFAVLIASGFDFMRRYSRAGSLLAVALAVFAIGETVPRAWRVIAPQTRREIVAGDVVRFLRRTQEPFRITGFVGATHLPNASRLTKIEDARLSAPILPLRAHLWWLAVDPKNRRFVFPTMRVTDRLDAALVADFNIRYVLQSRLPTVAGMHTSRGPRDAELSPDLLALPLALRAPSIEVRAIPGAKPRAHFARRVVVVPDVHAATALLMRDRQLAREAAVVESRLRLQVPPGAQGEISLHYPDDLHAVVDVASPTGGLVVLHDSFDRGWRALVDDTPAPILPVNILSRGVIVPPGRHRIAMEYRPPGFVAGSAISILTAILLLALGVGSARSASRCSRSDPEAAVRA